MNIGIMGNGYIVNVLLETCSCIENIKFVSLCVRPGSKEKGEDISKKYGIEKVHFDIDDFLNDDCVDTVYIGVINSLHYEYAMKCLLAGKNVICEKPFTKTFKEADELFKTADKMGVYLFEAITTIHMPMYKKVREHIKNIGTPRIINCSFCQYSSRYDKYLSGDVAPVFKKELFGGALVDLNIYNIHFTVSIFGEPKNVFYFPNYGKNGVDVSGVLIMDYGEFKAVCIASKDSQSESYAIIQGENGFIKIGSSLNNCENCIIDTSNCKEIFDGFQDHGRMYYEFSAFIRIIEKNDKTTYDVLKNETLLTMKVLEKAYKSM